MSNQAEILIKKIQYKTGMSLDEIAEKIGYSRPHLNNIKLKGGGAKIIGRLKEEFSEILQNDTSEVHEPGGEIRGSSYIETRKMLKNSSHDIPVYGGFTTLGNIQVIDDENVKHKVIGALPTDIFPGCDYAEKAKGDSMYPLIMNQALLIGKVSMVQGITYGEKYIIKTKDGMDTTKYVHPGVKKGTIKLKAYNKSVPEQEIPVADIIFVCRVHWIVNPT